MPSTKQRDKRRSSNQIEAIRQMQRSFQSRGIASVAELELRAASVDVESRSVRAVVATNSPTLVPDWERGEMVDEVLVIEGMRAAASVPFLENHSRWSLDDQIGGVDQITPNSRSGEVEARLRFSDFGNEDEVGKRINRAWQRVQDGFSRSVSVGYRALESAYIRAGQSQEINGKRYTAGNRTLKVTTSWELREVSLVPIGADPSAIIRAFHGGAKMPQSQASPGENREAQQGAAPVQQVHHVVPDAARASQEAAVPTQAPPQVHHTATVDAVRAERERVIAIDAVFAPENMPELRQRAISEGWSAERAASEVLHAIRSNRPQPVDRSAPAIHSRSHESTFNKDSLMLAMVSKMGVALDASPFGQRRWKGALPEILRKDINDPDRQRAMDFADELRSMSLVDVCREAIRLSGQSIPFGTLEIAKRAFSTAELGDIFSNSISAAVLVGYAESPDSTVEWTSESEVPNFLSNERVAMGKFGRLKQLKTGGTAEHLDIDAAKETYKVKRYAGQFVIDEQDIINDALMAMEQVSPSDMGAAAAQLRPDLVYSILLANASLADSVALFHATHANLNTSSALTTTTLGVAVQNMMKQRIEGRPLNLRGRYLVVPADLKVTADNVATSRQRADTTSGAGSDNVVSQYGISVIADDRIGATGVTNPDGGASLAGSATTWYLMARPGENGAKTIEVGYIRGSGRAPQIRQYALSQGQFGIGFDVAMDIGAKALDFRGMARNTA